MNRSCLRHEGVSAGSGTLSLVVLALAAILVACSGENRTTKASWPTRPIQITCFAAPGGGTDTVDRTIAQVMEPLLGVKINVVNKKGARGGTAMRDVWSRKHDGYRWGGFSESILTAPVMGGHDTTAKDWTYFMVAGAPGVVSVPSGSPYRTLGDLVATAKAEPGKINAAASITGGIWHTKLITLERAAHVTFNYVPYGGSNPSQIAALSGEVDVVLTSISEQAELIKARNLRPLAMVEAEPYEFPVIGTIPSAAREYPDVAKFPVTQWLGFALPADTPPDVLETITDAFNRAMQSVDVREMLATRYLTPFGYSGARADGIARETERVWTWLLHDLKIAERSPEELGIPRS